MNQAEILKELILNYMLASGDPNDVNSIIVYVTAHKPSGTGRVNEVIVRAILKQLGITPTKTQPMIESPPPAAIETAPETVISFEKVAVDPASARSVINPTVEVPVLGEAYDRPSVPVKPTENVASLPESVPVENSPNAQAPKGLWRKIKAKFWK